MNADNNQEMFPLVDEEGNGEFGWKKIVKRRNPFG